MAEQEERIEQDHRDERHQNEEARPDEGHTQAQDPQGQVLGMADPPIEASGDGASTEQLGAVDLHRTDSEERQAALTDLDAEGEGLRILIDALENDPDPGVRAIAARQASRPGSSP